jgi:hypothetical protein
MTYAHVNPALPSLPVSRVTNQLPEQTWAENK